jgi:cell division protein FtsL
MAGRELLLCSDVEDAVQKILRYMEKLQLENPKLLSQEKVKEVAVKHGLVDNESKGRIIIYNSCSGM